MHETEKKNGFTSFLSWSLTTSFFFPPSFFFCWEVAAVSAFLIVLVCRVWLGTQAESTAVGCKVNQVFHSGYLIRKQHPVTLLSLGNQIFSWGKAALVRSSQRSYTEDTTHNWKRHFHYQPVFWGNYSLSKKKKTNNHPMVYWDKISSIFAQFQGDFFFSPGAWYYFREWLLSDEEKCKVLQEGEIFLIALGRVGYGKVLQDLFWKAHIWSGLNNEQETDALDVCRGWFWHKAIFGSRILHVVPMLEAGLTKVKPKQMHCLLVTFLRKRGIEKFPLFYNCYGQPLSLDAILAAAPSHPSDYTRETQCTVGQHLGVCGVRSSPMCPLISTGAVGHPCYCFWR